MDRVLRNPAARHARGGDAQRRPRPRSLDRVAASQRNETRRLQVTAPTDPGDKALALAMRRGVTARDDLIERGLDASRFSDSAVPRNTTVKIVIVASASP